MIWRSKTLGATILGGGLTKSGLSKHRLSNQGGLVAMKNSATTSRRTFKGLCAALLFSASLFGGQNSLNAADKGIMDGNDGVVSGFSGIKPCA